MKRMLLFLVVTLFIGLGILGYSMLSGNASGATYESLQIKMESDRLVKLEREFDVVSSELAEERRIVASSLGKIVEYEERVDVLDKKLGGFKSDFLIVTYEALLQNAKSKLKHTENRLEDARLRSVLLEKILDYLTDAMDLANANIEYFEISESKRLENSSN